MINPIIFQFNLLGLPIVLRWYGVLVMLGAVVGTWIAENEIKRRGENGESIWDGLVWVLPAGIIGARLWYVVNNILGGGTYYVQYPVKILYVWEGGLHFFGGLLFGGIALYFFLKQNGMDIWLFLDAIAPAIFIGQALARPANFINQELYGPPTKLPWGIPIDAAHRLTQYADLSKYPVETTRFHPTFAYEMVLNILLALLLIWISRQYAAKMKPGAVFSGWLVFAGLARTFIEFFRPDQPRIGNSFVTYSMFVSILMAIAGVVMLLIRYGKLHLAAAENWENEYHIKPLETKVRSSLQNNESVVIVNKESTPRPAAKKSSAKPTAKSPVKKPVKKVVKATKAVTKKSVVRSKTTKPKTTKK
jgi:phosphatidylglycerol:prolipoprotein diacylglycerol transferase